MKRYKVWAVKPCGEAGDRLIADGYPADETCILILRTGAIGLDRVNDGPFEVREPYNGRPMQVAKLAHERTGYIGVILIKDFDTEEWHTGAIGTHGSIMLVSGNCPEMFRGWNG